MCFVKAVFTQKTQTMAMFIKSGHNLYIKNWSRFWVVHLMVVRSTLNIALVVLEFVIKMKGDIIKKASE